MPFFGVSLKKIFGSLFMLIAIMDLVAFRYNPERDSNFAWTFNQVTANMMKLRNTSYWLADKFCNDPEECKNAIDESFKYVSAIPQDVFAKIAEFLRNVTTQPTKEHQDGAAVQEHHREAKKQVANYSIEQAALKGDASKAEGVIKSLKFTKYVENNLCDLKEGIPLEKYDFNVDKIAALTNMPENLKDTIKLAKDFEDGEVLALKRMEFINRVGNMVFGKVVVIRRGKVLDLVYSLHSLDYKLKRSQPQPGNAEKMKQYRDSLEDGEDAEISIDLKDDFSTYFHEQAIRGFNKHCDVLLKTLNAENFAETLTTPQRSQRRQLDWPKVNCHA